MPKMMRWLRRCKERWSWFRTSVIGLLFILGYMRYRILRQSDLDLYNSALYNDPDDVILHGNRLHQRTAVFFPVLPNNVDKQTTPTPLKEEQVIPGGSIFKERFKQILQPYSAQNIILSVVDYGFIDMTLNFIKTSIVKLNLQAVFIPVCLDEESHEVLSQHGYKCVLFDLGLNGSRLASDFGSKDYYRKTNIKTWVMLQALLLGHTVLLSDVDIILFKEPFPYFRCADCDIHIQMDRELYNSGFVYARPTPGSLAVYSNAWRFYLQYHTGHDQAYINMAITMLLKNDSIKTESLSWREFPCGVYYFEQAYRQFYNERPCQDCVMAHNNYMGSTAAKIYRFKENLLWEIVENGYYTSLQARYMTYENPYDFGKTTIEIERDALLNALILSNLTNRILILPSFRCCNCRTKSCDHPSNRCSLLTVLKLKTFDQFFKGKYREHSFPSHRLVPDKIKMSISPWIGLNISSPLSYMKDISQFVFKDMTSEEQTTLNMKGELSSSHLVSVLDKYSDYSILRFKSLYGDMNFSEELQFLKNRFRTEIECGLYEQWEESLEKKFFG